MQTLVPPEWIGCKKQVHHHHHKTQSTRNSSLDWCKSGAIDQEIDTRGYWPVPSVLSQWLDKPVHSAMSQTYANILKSNSPLPQCQPHPMQPKIDPQANGMQQSLNMSQTICWIWLCPLLPPLQPVTLISSTTMTNMADYATKLMSTKTELTTLWTIITLAVEQIKSAIESLPRASLSNAMETEAKHPIPKSHSCPSPIDIHDLVTNLNHEIATIVIKTRALFQQQATSMLTTCTMQLSITWISIRTNVGLPS